MTFVTPGVRLVISRIQATHRATVLMSRRNRRQDETWMKESVTAALNTGDQNDRLSTGGCRRRSLFSTERLDLILSNLRRNLVSGSDQCKQISHDVSYSGDAEPPQQQQQQQQQHGAGKLLSASVFYCRMKQL